MPSRKNGGVFAYASRDITGVAVDLQNGVFRFPAIVKSTDSSSSKGVGKIKGSDDMQDKLEYAMSISKGKRIIIEEFVGKFGYQVPDLVSFPYHMPSDIQDKIHNEIQRLLTLLQMGTTAYNFDIRIDRQYNVYLMEVAPRNGETIFRRLLNMQQELI